MSSIESALEYARGHHDAFLDQYKELLSIPSVSAMSEHAGDVQRCAEWMAAQLRALKMAKVEIVPTAGHPIVYAEWLDAPGKPTVLVYGHYDVQPVDPLNEWTTVYGRLTPPTNCAANNSSVRRSGMLLVAGGRFAGGGTCS